jgi:hypothetical protein
VEITKISCDNFLQIKAMDIDLTTAPVNLIAGLNESGKSSLHEAIRFALLGETDRVSLKRDYPSMVRSGAKEGAVRVEYIDAEGNHDFVHRSVGDGKLIDGFEGEQAFAVAECMDATKYPTMNSKHQRDMVRDLLQISIDPEEVMKLIARKGLPEEIMEQIKPMLRAGFEAAHKDAKARQSEARAKWEQLSGEKWGAVKGGEWKPTRRPIVQSMVDAQEKISQTAFKAFSTQSDKAAALKAFSGGTSAPCPSCGEQLVWSGKEVKLASDEPDPDEMKAHTKAKSEANKLQALWQAEVKSLDELQVSMDFNERMDEIAKESVELHTEILHWLQGAELLAPDGIPGQIIGELLKPVNDRLRNTATISGWDQVQISATMDIMVGTLPYMLGSESSQWRAQAAIAEAISYISGVGLLCLDRFDVLDVGNRNRLLKWISKIADDHTTILLFGTLKEPPKKLPPSFALHWLEHGDMADLAA